MKQQLSFALLTISIFSLNLLPTKAVNAHSSQTVTNSTESGESINDKYTFFTDGEWCVEVPWMGFICW